MVLPVKVISGGQSGADLTGIKWSLWNSIDCEINAEYLYKPLNNETIPYGCLINIVSNKIGKNGGWIERRRYNVRNSDYTLIFVRFSIEKTKGSLGTMRDCETYDKPYSVVVLNEITTPDADTIRTDIEIMNTKILNIAGERYLSYPERRKMEKVLDRIFLINKR